MWKIVSVGILCLCLGACGTTNLPPAASGLSDGIVPPNGDTAAKFASAGPTDLLPAPRLHSPHNPAGFAPSHTYALGTAAARKTPSAKTKPDEPALPVTAPPLQPPSSREAAKPAESAPAVIAPPLQPPVPREAAKPAELAPPALKPPENENLSTVVAPASPIPEPVKIEPTQPEVQTQPLGSAPESITKPPAPASSAETSDKPKISIVPAPLFE
jgi:hypothetical protein